MAAASPEISSSISIASPSPISQPISSPHAPQDSSQIYGMPSQLPSPASGSVGLYSHNSTASGHMNQTMSGPIQSSNCRTYSPQPPTMQIPPQLISTSLPTHLNHLQIHQTIPAQPLGNTTLLHSPQEEITTIFVVGFPEDMQEREFQNMFTFCSGFEAATLKIPLTNVASENTPVALPTNPISGDFELIQQPRKYGGCGAVNGVTIGFAKFSTRLEALDALRVLNGRKVDAEKISILKAEMAKKNLHTKRGLSNDNSMTTTGSTYGIMGRRSTIATIPTPRDLYCDSDFYTLPIPRDILSQVDYLDVYSSESSRLTKSSPLPAVTHNNKPANAAVIPCYVIEDATSFVNANGIDSATSSRGGSTNTSGMRTPQSMMERTSYERCYNDIIDPIMMNNLLARSAAVSNGPSSQTSPTISTTPNSIPSTTERRYSTVEAFANGSVSSNNNNKNQRGFHSALYQSESLLIERMGPLSISGNASGVPNSANSGASQSTNESVASSSPSAKDVNNDIGYVAYVDSVTLPRSASVSENSARNSDSRVTDYPPCNTLYVGNLPMNTSEDELRDLFSKCSGYKRLCFRQRSSGPLTKAASPYPQCFVEFEDIACANLALRELYGNPLSNSTKGGIRLSYSKNPLGKRSSDTLPSQQQSQQNQPQQLQQQAFSNCNSLNMSMMSSPTECMNEYGGNTMPQVQMGSPRYPWNNGTTLSSGTLNVLSPPFIPASMQSLHIHP